MLRAFLFACLSVCIFSVAHPEENDAALWQAYQQKRGSYPLQTRYADAAGSPKYVNSLILETSPYLLQHAHNPIRWHAWSDETLATAAREKRLIFLSIGYSTCHWCHVMARESFDNEAVALLLNEKFVSIKVDREEHPELDEHFLAALEFLTPSAGWPMTLILAPDGRPVAGESYLTEERLTDLLKRFARAWDDRPQQVLRQAATLAERIKPATQVEPQGIDDLYRLNLGQIRGRYDAVHHGFGMGPRFPESASLLLLLDAYRRQGKEEDRSKFVATLEAMATSALQDPIDGGFHRYSVTADWQRPHYEKMLYDQARLAALFAEAWALTGNKAFEWSCRRTIDFVIRHLRARNGLFFSAVDAGPGDGAFYTWSNSELADALGPGERRRIGEYFRRVPQEGGRFILLPNTLPPDSAAEKMIEKLRKLRRQRAPLFVDKKSVSAWNALMIEAVAQAGRKLGDPGWRQAAADMMNTLLEKNIRNGRVLRYSIENGPGLPGTLEDIAALLHALATLHEIDGDPHWLAEARRTMESLPDDATLTAQFGLFAVDRDGPSTAASLLDALDRLFRQSGERRYKKQLDRFSALAPQVLRPSLDQASLVRQLYQATHPAPQQKAFLAGGHIRAEISSLQRKEGDMEFGVAIRMSPGWHINSHRPLQDYLKPTRVTSEGGRLERVRYPEGKTVRLGFADQPLAVYEGTIVVRGRVPATAAPVVLLLELQACNDRFCLPPEAVRLFAGAADTPPPVSSGREP